MNALSPNRVHKGASARVVYRVPMCVNFFSKAGRRAARRYGLKLRGTSWVYIRGEG
jgi:hypothetical protein